MVCYWAVQREQNKDQIHSTPFDSVWPLYHYLSKLERGGEAGGGGAGGGIHRPGPAAPAPPPRWAVRKEVLNPPPHTHPKWGTRVHGGRSVKIEKFIGGSFFSRPKMMILQGIGHPIPQLRE